MPNNQNQSTEDRNSAAQINQKSKDSNAEVKTSSSVKSADGSSPVEAAKDTAQTVLNLAKDSAGQAYGLAAEKTTSKIQEQKTNFSSGLSGIAESIRQVGNTLRGGEEKNVVTDLTGKYGEKIADQIESVSGYIENRELKQIVSDVEKFARRQPAIFVAAAFVTGLLAARFLKSSGNSVSQSPRKLTDGNANSDRQKSNKQNNQTASSAS